MGLLLKGEMMRLRLSRHRMAVAAIIIPLMILTQAFGCGGFLKVTEKIAAENAHFTNAVIIAHKDLDASGKPFVDDATETVLLTASKRIAQYDDAAAQMFVDQNKQGVLNQVDQALATVDTDIANGILGIKNSDRRLQLQAVVAGLRSLIITAKTYVVAQGGK